MIRGKSHGLWRGIDNEGEALDCLVHFSTNGGMNPEGLLDSPVSSSHVERTEER